MQFTKNLWTVHYVIHDMLVTCVMDHLLSPCKHYKSINFYSDAVLSVPVGKQGTNYLHNGQFTKVMHNIQAHYIK